MKNIYRYNKITFVLKSLTLEFFLRFFLKKNIIGIEAVERLTTLGIAVNLVTYLTGTMHLGNASSANNVTNFLGTSFMLTLLGGFVADTFLGRFVNLYIP